MQITFDHTDLANPEALSVLRRVIGGDVAPALPALPDLSNFGRPVLDQMVVAAAVPVPEHLTASLAAPVPEPVAALTELETPPAPEVVEAACADLLDSSGIMWDARIHASTRTKVQDGTWKMKRGVEPEIVAQVMAELKGAPAPTKVEQFAAQVDPSTLGFGATVPTPPPTVAAVPVPPVPVPMADASDWPADLLGPHRPGFEFQAFMNYVMGRVNSGIPTPTLLATCKGHDVASFNAVNGRPEVIPALARALSQLQKAA